MSKAVLLSEDRGAVRLLRMNRPEKLNALNFELTQALLDSFEALKGEDAVRAVVLAGEGRAFCAGADRTEFPILTSAAGDLVEKRAEMTASLHAAIPACRVPVIAAVNGFAMGGGAGLALACDFVFASPLATFAYPELGHGIVAAVVMASLVRDAGRKVAFDLVTTGRRVGAEELVQLRLVNRLVSAEALLDEALEFAATISKYEPRAVAETKRLLHQVSDVSLAEGLVLGRAANARMRAFLEAEQNA